MAHRHIIQCVLFVRWFLVIVQLQTQVTAVSHHRQCKEASYASCAGTPCHCKFSFTCQWTTNIVPVTFFPSSMTKQSNFEDVLFSLPGRANQTWLVQETLRGMKVAQLDSVVSHARSRRGRVGFRPTYIFGLRSWPFVLGVRGWFHVVVIGIVMLEIDIFASSTGEFNIITVAEPGTLHDSGLCRLHRVREYDW